ncbi:MAG: hypothetical protein V4565_00560 [Bacteroidota bacterium]
MWNIALLIGTGIICLITTIITLVFGVIALANNKPGKFLWLSVFLTSLIVLITCIFIGVRKAAHTVQEFAENTTGQFEQYADSLSGSQANSNVEKHEISPSSAQIKTLKSYLSPNIINNEPEEFYSYAGFNDYYRYPIRYPFSIHCMDSKGYGELYNEVDVSRFDENDNGEIFSGISDINKIAFDKNYLLIEQALSSTRTDKLINHYILFNFETEKKEEVPSLQKLLQLAKSKGYTGCDSLMTLEQYYNLF